MQDWVDLDLIAKLARAYPRGSVVVVGKSLVDTQKLASIPNVHLLGRKPYEALPGYCKGFDAAIIPFLLNELTRNVNPIKLREYLSAGLPVVSTEIPEVALYASDAAGAARVSVARTHDDFLAAVARELAGDTPDKRCARSDAMKSETWEKKVEALGATIDRVRRAKAEREGRRPTA